MKKLLLITALMAAFAAQAATWEHVADDVDGETQMWLDVASIEPGTSTDGYALISGDLKFVDKKDTVLVSYIITPQSCILGGGLVLARVTDGKNWSTVGKYKWSEDGGHLYDYAAMAMCVVMKEKIDAATPEKEPVQKKHQAIPQGNMV
jgi:hypothetical protein